MKTAIISTCRPEGGRDKEISEPTSTKPTQRKQNETWHT